MEATVIYREAISTYLSSSPAKKAFPCFNKEPLFQSVVSESSWVAMDN